MKGEISKNKTIFSHLILKLQSRSIPRSFPARRRPGWFPVAGGRRSVPCPWPQGAAAAGDAGSYLHCEKIGESIFHSSTFRVLVYVLGVGGELDLHGGAREKHRVRHQQERELLHGEDLIQLRRYFL